MDVTEMLKNHQNAPVEYRRFYDLIGKLMRDVGMYGEVVIASDSDFSRDCMDALKKIDSGMQFDVSTQLTGS